MPYTLDDLKIYNGNKMSKNEKESEQKQTKAVKEEKSLISPEIKEQADEISNMLVKSNLVRKVTEGLVVTLLIALGSVIVALVLKLIIWLMTL